jgi:hypothetical protein
LFEEKPTFQSAGPSHVQETVLAFEREFNRKIARCRDVEAIIGPVTIALK